MNEGESRWADLRARALTALLRSRTSPSAASNFASLSSSARRESLQTYQHKQRLVRRAAAPPDSRLPLLLPSQPYLSSFAICSFNAADRSGTGEDIRLEGSSTETRRQTGHTQGRT